MLRLIDKGIYNLQLILNLPANEIISIFSISEFGDSEVIGFDEDMLPYGVAPDHPAFQDSLFTRDRILSRYSLLNQHGININKRKTLSAYLTKANLNCYIH